MKKNISINDEAAVLLIRLEALQIRESALTAKINALTLLNDRLKENMDTSEGSPLRRLEFPPENAQLAGIPRAKRAYRRKSAIAKSAEESESLKVRKALRNSEASEAAPPRKRGRKKKEENASAEPKIPAVNKKDRDGYIGKILKHLSENQNSNIGDIHKKLGGLRSAVINGIQYLKKEGLVSHEGSASLGHYALTKEGKKRISESGS